MRMKVANIANVDKFMETIDTCQGKIELVINKESYFNLKSKFSQNAALVKLLSGEKIGRIELVTERISDTAKLIEFVMIG